MFLDGLKILTRVRNVIRYFRGDYCDSACSTPSAIQDLSHLGFLFKQASCLFSLQAHTLLQPRQVGGGTGQCEKRKFTHKHTHSLMGGEMKAKARKKKKAAAQMGRWEDFTHDQKDRAGVRGGKKNRGEKSIESFVHFGNRNSMRGLR